VESAAVADLDVHLDGIVAGDTEAFAAWVAGAEPSIRASLRGFARTVDTEVVVQEALLRAWQVAPQVSRDGRGNSLLRVALRTARHLAIDEARRTRPTQPLASDGEPAELAAEPVEPDPRLRETIQLCREQLPPQPGLVLSARLECRGGQSDESLAADMGMRLNTFLQNVTRARRLLADCLRRHGIELAEVVR
jgi:RNA polymerase sigma-70 factor (ECF subfamily)